MAIRHRRFDGQPPVGVAIKHGQPSRRQRQYYRARDHPGSAPRHAACSSPRQWDARVKVGILGGTGPQGRGLARRLAAAGHEVVMGSRSAERAERIAAEYPSIEDAGGITGGSNLDAAAAELVIVTRAVRRPCRAVVIPRSLSSLEKSWWTVSIRSASTAKGLIPCRWPPAQRRRRRGAPARVNGDCCLSPRQRRFAR